MTANDSATTYTVPVPGDKGGTRLDRMLADHLPDISRTRVKALIVAGNVVRLGAARPDEGGGAVRDPAYRVRAGECLAVRVPAPRPATPRPQAMDLAVIHEDADLIVIDKPPGLVVHPAPGHPDGTLVNALLAHCGATLSGIGGVSRPGIVHRLDKDTSGLMVATQERCRPPRIGAPILRTQSRASLLRRVVGRAAPTKGRDYRQHRAQPPKPKTNGGRRETWQIRLDPLRRGAHLRRPGESRGMPPGHGAHSPNPGPSGQPRAPGDGGCPLWRRTVAPMGRRGSNAHGR